MRWLWMLALLTGMAGCSLGDNKESVAYDAAQPANGDIQTESALDIKNKGKDDIAAMYDFGSAQASIYVWPTTGSNFDNNQTWWALPAGQFAASSTTGRFVSGDFNGDGKVDAAAMYDYGSSHSAIKVWLSTGNGFGSTLTWMDSTVFPATGVTGRFAAGDFNGDGNDDIAAMYDYGSSHSAIKVWLSTGNGFGSTLTWMDSTVFPATGVTGRFAAGDFNGDGKDDIAAMYDYGSSHSSIKVWLSTGSGFGSTLTWMDSTAFQAPQVTERFVAGDFNGDGKDDIAAMYDYLANHAAIKVWTSTGTAFGTTQTWMDSTVFNSANVTGRLIAGKFTKDSTNKEPLFSQVVMHRDGLGTDTSYKNSSIIYLGNNAQGGWVIPIHNTASGAYQGCLVRDWNGSEGWNFRLDWRWGYIPASTLSAQGVVNLINACIIMGWSPTQVQNKCSIQYLGANVNVISAGVGQVVHIPHESQWADTVYPNNMAVWLGIKDTPPYSGPGVIKDGVLISATETPLTSVAVADCNGNRINAANSRLDFNSGTSRYFLSKITACFEAGTKVPTQKGIVKIEDIKVGDLVLSRNSETGESGYKKVSKLSCEKAERIVELTINGEIIKATESHPFLTADNRWIMAGNLVIGQKLKNGNGWTATVEKKDRVSRETTVYNFEVEDWETFCVGDGAYVVHNECSIASWNAASATTTVRIGSYTYTLGIGSLGGFTPPLSQTGSISAGRYPEYINNAGNSSYWSTEGTYSFGAMAKNAWDFAKAGFNGVPVNWVPHSTGVYTWMEWGSYNIGRTVGWAFSPIGSALILGTALTIYSPNVGVGSQCTPYNSGVFGCP